MKSAFIALVLIAIHLLGISQQLAFAQNGGHPNGDYGLYIGDHASWQAEQDARAIAREEIAKEQQRQSAAAEAAQKAEMTRRHCAPSGGNSMICDAN
jgi:hypothetical protein